MGHSRGFFRHFGLHVGRDEDGLRKHAARTWTIQLRMMDEHRNNWIFLLRNYIARTWVFKAIHVEEMKDRGQRATPEVYQRGGEAQPLANLSNRGVETL